MRAKKSTPKFPFILKNFPLFWPKQFGRKGGYFRNDQIRSHYSKVTKASVTAAMYPIQIVYASVVIMM